ncbi:hypothetical protein HMPREF0666_02014 [Prevotella sp. C561]|nr:hypothetical protein HMPREF0666_02014 [Prevotella sp. C561]
MSSTINHSLATKSYIPLFIASLLEVSFYNLYDVKIIKTTHELKYFSILINKLNIFYYLCIYSLKHDTPIL